MGAEVKFIESRLWRKNGGGNLIRGEGYLVCREAIFNSFQMKARDFSLYIKRGITPFINGVPLRQNEEVASASRGVAILDKLGVVVSNR